LQKQISLHRQFRLLALCSKAGVMTNPVKPAPGARLFLVAPKDISPELLLACATAACAAGDCATILLPSVPARETVAALQALNLAVLLQDVEPRDMHHVNADGLQLADVALLKEARENLKSQILGFVAGVSRHAAMEAAEAGADYVAFTQSKQVVGEPIIGWWQDVAELPGVAMDAVEDAALKPQRPDFIRPSDAMWHSAEQATSVISDLVKTWSA
jgi:thiamine-phosphate pyrophosphorylase